METKPPALFSTKNIPEEMLVGLGTLKVLECKDIDTFNKAKSTYHGLLFHTVYEGRFFIRLPKGEVKKLEQYTEQ